MSDLPKTAAWDEAERVFPDDCHCHLAKEMHDELLVWHGGCQIALDMTTRRAEQAEAEVERLQKENEYLRSGAASGRPYIDRLCLGCASVIGYEETAYKFGRICHKRCV